MEATLQEKAAQAAQVAADAAKAAQDAALTAQLESVKHLKDFDTLAEGNHFDSARLKSAFIRVFHSLGSRPSVEDHAAKADSHVKKFALGAFITRHNAGPAQREFRLMLAPLVKWWGHLPAIELYATTQLHRLTDHARPVKAVIQHHAHKLFTGATKNGTPRTRPTPTH